MTQEDLELPAGFGAPSGSMQKYENWKLKGADDEIEIRVLPMMKSLLKIDDFGLDWKLHFGWNGKSPKDPTKPQYHPFLCIEEKNYGMVTVECPACVYRSTYVKRLEAAKLDMANQVNALKERGKAKGIAEAEINKAVVKLQEKLITEMKPDADWVYNHGRDGKFRIPCINRQGQFGIFSAPYGVLHALRKEMNSLKQRVYPGTDIKIQAAGRKGVWFKITRTGRASRDSDTVKVCRIVRDDGAELLDFQVITNEQLQQAQERLPDLVELRDQNRISVAQIEALVALDKAGGGSSDPLAVDEIFSANKKASSTQNESDWTGASPTGVSAVETPKPQPVKEEVKVAETPKTVEPKVEVKAEVKEEAKPASINAADMPDADFDSLWT